MYLEFHCHTGKTVDDIQLDEFDALAIPGGFEEAGFYRDAYSREFLHVIQHFYAKQKPIASICVASLTLGKSGILVGKKLPHTVIRRVNEKSS